MATGRATGASDHGEPFKWSKSADKILALVKRFCQKTQNTLCSELQTHGTSVPQTGGRLPSLTAERARLGSLSARAIARARASACGAPR
jgi:hypothetical protein